MKVFELRNVDCDGPRCYWILFVSENGGDFVEIRRYTNLCQNEKWVEEEAQRFALADGGVYRAKNLVLRRT
jgi:hypothetical protein